MHPTGERIRARRLAERIRPERLAQELGISRARYYKREAEGNFTDEQLDKIARVLKCQRIDLRPNGMASPLDEQLVKDLARALPAALERHGVDLDPEPFSELFNALHRVFSERGHIDSRSIDAIVATIKKARAKP